MLSLTTFILSLSLLASETLGAPNSSGPSKHARWLQVPRTLHDPEFLKRDNLGSRAPADVAFSPLEKKDIFQRQTSTCGLGGVECQGDKCCPAGYNCSYSGGTSGCCRVGIICTGSPVGCADPHSLECPTSIGGCCPIGEACYRDSAGVARCDNAGLYSSSIAAPSITPTFATPIFTPTTSTFSPVTTPTSTPVVPAITVTVRSSAEKMAMKVDVITVMMGALVALA